MPFWRDISTPATSEPAGALLLLQETHLSQHRGMIPINTLTGEFLATKLHDDDDIHGDLFVCRWDVWQQPRHWFTMSERDMEFIH